MPGYDKTGPQGLGPLTGRGLGICVDGTPRFRRYGRGLGMGFGRGFGRRILLDSESNLSRIEEKSLPKEDLKELEAEMKEIERRLEELD